MTEEKPVEYRDIPDWPGYRVGDDGSVWSRWMPGRRVLTDKWHQMVIWYCDRNRPHVTLRKDGKRKTFRVHCLIMTVFRGTRPEGMQVCHDPDPDPRNCALDNLRWGTHEENMKDRDRHGRTARGDRSGPAKLTEAQVRKIRMLLKEGAKSIAMARQFSVSRSTIHRIKQRIHWKHVIER